ncbi:MAG TPA: hypothetical protein VFT08_04610, partial [Pyrinomonadaceae bacterium]|nr:hypothetical protein [Pyrinomonadaceae bacterium]
MVVSELMNVARSNSPSSVLAQYKLKLYSSCIATDTARPSRIAGSNLIRRAAAIARSVNPNGKLHSARIWTTS